MDFEPRAPRPAVFAAAGLLAGTAVGWSADSPALCILGGGLFVLAIWGARALGRGAAWCAIVGCFLLGTGLHVEEAVVPLRWAQAGLPRDGGVASVHLRGDVARPIVRDLEGARWLELRAQVEPSRMRPSSIGPSPTELRLRLRVAPSPDEPSKSLDRLRVGDRVRVWCRLRLPRRAGNPQSADPRRWMRAAGLDGIGSVKSARLVERRRGGTPGLRRLAGLSRVVAGTRLDGLLGELGERRGLAGAILLGERRRLAPETSRALRAAGLSHLIAISGLHVGILVALLIGMLRAVRCRGWALFATAIPCLLFFTLFVGARPSVTRAVMAAALFLFARALGRDGDALNGVAAVLSLLLAISPSSVSDPGFQLTFLATAGILCAAGKLERRLPLYRRLRSATAVTLSAYIATAPAVAAQFGMLAPVGLLTNLAAIPLCAVLLVSGYASILFGEVPLFGALCRLPLRMALDGILSLGRIGAAWPEVSWYVPAPGAASISFAYGFLVAAIGYRGPRPRRRLLLAGLALTMTWIHLGPPPAPADGRVRAAVIDVGQGQAVAVRGADGGLVLIDAGGGYGGYDPGEREVVPFLRRWSGSRVDRLVLSHGHLDHAGGAAAVVRALEVGELWVGGGALRNERVRDLAAAVRERGGAIVHVFRGFERSPFGTRLEVLWPRRAGDHRRVNESSVVLRVGEAPSRLLLPGDIGSVTERRLVESSDDLDAEALVLSHHGSRDGSIRPFLERVAPRLAIVSCGRGNPFGHPDDDVLRRVRTVGAIVHRTDVAGMILLEQTPSGWVVKPPGSEGR